jgi:DICT domain-containing protein/signal transduction histidine kinase
MGISQSVVGQLLQLVPGWRPQMYFKSSLTALSHAMEDRVLASSDRPLIVASFQKERFYKQEAHRYQRIANKTDRVYVLAAPETDFKNSSEFYETIAFEPTDPLAQEWHLVIVGNNYTSCLVCREKYLFSPQDKNSSIADTSRVFEGIWTFNRQITTKAAAIMLKRILLYRPELKDKLEDTFNYYLGNLHTSLEEALLIEESIAPESILTDTDPFVQRLVTYLQASHYKLLKANKSLALKEQKERLLNTIATAIRRSLNIEEILQVAVQMLGERMQVCRCIVYRCHEEDTNAIINYEFLQPGIISVRGETWPLKNNPLFEEVLSMRESLTIENASSDPRLQSVNGNAVLPKIVKSCSIVSWLLVPVFYKDKLLGMVELHHCGPEPSVWKQEDIDLVNAIAIQVGVALIQAEAYANLQDLNQQLEALERTRSNLVAITGHELRTPLSTIQVCLESLASEPDMPPELREVMIDTALQDAERMRKLIQDFLTLSQLESGRARSHPEAISLKECVDLAISNVSARKNIDSFPQILNRSSEDLPPVEADGEWVVEVLAKLIDNACKFTNTDGKVAITTKILDRDYLEIIVTDTGRGIEPSRLEKVFERFYQEEGALRRSTGGTGLGLAICRQMVNIWGGKIWAESAGKDCGSQFHFTIPFFKGYSSNVTVLDKAIR